MGLFQGVFGFYLARHDVGLAAGGSLGLLGLAWSVKFLWSPVVERFGTRQAWIAGALLTMAGALAAVAWLPVDPLGPLWLAMALFCVASATQDIAIDAYTIGLVDRGREGPANAVRMTGYRVGYLAAASGLMALVAVVGWSGAFLAGALISLGLAAGLVLTPPVPLPPADERQPLRALTRWAARPGLVAVVLFVLLFRIGDRAMGPMIPFFWESRGIDELEYGVFNNALGAVATIGGAIAGGLWVSRGGIPAALWGSGVLALASNLVYALVAYWPDTGRLGIYAAAAFESLTSGAVGAAFISFLMRICEKRHAAVQYATLTGLYALAGSLLAGSSGWITERTGFAGYFALTAGFAAPAFALLRRASSWMLPLESEEA